MSDRIVRASKFLSLILRHQPEKIGLELDAAGWADVDLLLERINASGKSWSHELLEELVATSDKQRFRFSDDRRRIRASQGHSIQVDLQLQPQQPPPLLYHGTAIRNLPSIRKSGLTRRSRQHVHLSLDEATARTVGARHGHPTVLTIRAHAMHAAGHLFFFSDNGVWLTECVPPEYLLPISEHRTGDDAVL